MIRIFSSYDEDEPERGFRYGDITLKDIEITLVNHFKIKTDGEYLILESETMDKRIRQQYQNLKLLSYSVSGGLHLGLQCSPFASKELNPSFKVSNRLKYVFPLS
jgi:hypothetical protein